MKTLLCTMFIFFFVVGSPTFASADAMDIERELTNLEINLTDSMWSTQSLIERLSAIKEKVKMLQPSRPDIESRMKVVEAALMSRLSKDMNTEARKIIVATSKELSGYTGADYLVRVKAAEKMVEETRREILMLSENPETQFFQIEDETHSVLDSLKKEIAIRIAAVNAQTEAKQKIESYSNDLAGYTGVGHLAQIKTVREAVAETRRKITELSDNPEMYIPVDGETLMALDSFTRELLATKDNICLSAAKSQCVSSLPDFPEQYRKMLVFPGDTATILDIACAAKHQGFYKGFSTGGVFSNDILLTLENLTIYFKEQRYQSGTHRPVGSGYTGDDTYTILIATKMESAKGTQEVQNSPVEMLRLLGRLGGIPNVEECQE